MNNRIQKISTKIHNAVSEPRELPRKIYTKSRAKLQSAKAVPAKVRAQAQAKQAELKQKRAAERMELWIREHTNEAKLTARQYIKLGSEINGIPVNLRSPKGFNEKLQYLKLHDRNPAYTEMVDKAAAKDYVVRTLKAAGVQAPEQYIIPTLGLYKTWGEIDFAALPKQFVLKCTHDSGGLVIVKNKAEFLADPARVAEAQAKLEKSLARNYYYSGREWPYKNVPPRIIAEKYMEDKETAELRDYKFFCFNGKVEYFKIDFDRFVKHRANYYNRDAELQKFGEADFLPDYNKKLTMPKNLKTMIKYADLLSKNMAFVRVDFYEMNGKMYFGEITFYPASGFGKFTSEKADRALGDLIDLSLCYDRQRRKSH